MHIYAVEEAAGEILHKDVGRPKPTGRQVLVEVTHCGVCHSDTHIQDGGYDLGDRGWISMAERGLEYPVVLGHEIVGRVVEVGDAVEQVSPGEVGVVFPWIGCGSCTRCITGDENLCPSGAGLGLYKWGGFSSHVLIPDEKYLLDIEGLDPAWAATLACSGLTSYSAIDQVLPIAENEAVAVIGAGGVGLTAIALLSQLTDATVVAVDVSDERLEIAKNLGADIVVNSANGVDNIATAAEVHLHGVVDFVNTGATFDLAFNSLVKGGVLVSIGLFGGSTALPTALLPIKAINIRGSYVGNLRQLTALLEIAKTSDLPKLPIELKPMSLGTIQETMQDIRDGKQNGRVVLTNSPTA